MNSSSGREQVLTSLFMMKNPYFVFFPELTHTACRVILLPLDLVVWELLINHLILKVGKLRLRRAVCNQVKSEFAK